MSVSGGPEDFAVMPQSSLPWHGLDGAPASGTARIMALACAVPEAGAPGHILDGPNGRVRLRGRVRLTAEYGIVLALAHQKSTD